MPNLYLKLYKEISRGGKVVLMLEETTNKECYDEEERLGQEVGKKP